MKEAIHVLKYKVVSPHFKPEYLPRYATEGAAGMDLCACTTAPVTIRPGQRVRIPTGVAVQLPGKAFVGLVYARSGLAWRHGIALPNGVGVIDSDYTGEIQVLLTNLSDEPATIEPGDRIAQFVLAPIYLAHLSLVDEFESTARGTGGFGSTGVSPV